MIQQTAMELLSQLINKDLLSTYYLPHIVLGKQIEGGNLAFTDLTIQRGETEKQSVYSILNKNRC